MFKLIRSWLLAFITPRPLVGVAYLPRYFAQWHRYRRASTEKVRLRDSYPCLTDWTPHTPFDPHYFFQGAWLARRVRRAGPKQHVDIASSVMTVSVLSAMVDTVFVDYRPLQVSLPGLESRAGDILALPFAKDEISSLSCLHVIEHIGLGRYGDPLDVAGSAKAARELARVLAPRGRLYISMPVGRERVCFNAHRVHAPESVVELFAGLELMEFGYVDDAGEYHEKAPLAEARELDYGCGFFLFTKPV
jgi:SAM-dependent methyltransferase